MPTKFSCIICKDFDPKLRYFHMPNECNRRQLWSSALRLELKSNSIICEKHFLKQHITKCAKMNCFKLTNDATPKLHLCTDDDKFHLSSSQYEEPLNKKQTFQRTIGIQTEIKDAGICAYVTVAQNYMLYNVNCLFCDATFSMRDWEQFILHMRKYHRQEDDTFFDCGLNFDSEGVVEENIKPNMTAMETGNCHLNVEQMDFLEAEDTGKDSEFAEKILDNQTESDETSENDWEEESATRSYGKCSKNEHTVVVQNKNLYKKPPVPRDKKDFKIDVETSDPVIMNGLIDLFESYPNLWFIVEHKASEHAIISLTKKFNEQFKLELSFGEICDSLRNISAWYQAVCQKQNEIELSHPKSEYFRKCSKFLPDKLNGITCKHCKLLMPDHLQYYAHKKRKHEMSANDETDERELKFLGIPRTEINNYLEVRYPQSRGKPLYECKVCAQIFKRKSKYFDHIKTHLNVRDLVCDICGTTFIKKQGLEKHKLHKHFITCHKDDYRSQVYTRNKKRVKRTKKKREYVEKMEKPK